MFVYSCSQTSVSHDKVPKDSVERPNDEWTKCRSDKVLNRLSIERTKSAERKKCRIYRRKLSIEFDKNIERNERKYRTDNRLLWRLTTIKAIIY